MLLDPKSFDLICKTVDWLMRDSLDPALLNREADFGATSNFRFEHHHSDALNADAAGFGSYAQFYKVFTHAYGRGPRECMQPKAAP